MMREIQGKSLHAYLVVLPKSILWITERRKSELILSPYQSYSMPMLFFCKIYFVDNREWMDDEWKEWRSFSFPHPFINCTL
jgi:hypothetical protein